MGNSHNKLSQVQFVTALDILRAHCTKGDDGYVKYEPGWTDERVHEQFTKDNPEPTRLINCETISNMRLRLMGRERSAPGQAKADVFTALRAEVETLKAQVQALRFDVNLLHTKQERLLAWSNTVVDFMQRRGYTPPPGRPQSTPPDVAPRGTA